MPFLLIIPLVTAGISLTSTIIKNGQEKREQERAEAEQAAALAAAASNQPPPPSALPDWFIPAAGAVAVGLLIRRVI